MANVLIADDVKSEAELMAQVVRGLGHTVYIVEDGESCLAAVPQVKPSLILLDVVMPRLDGFNTCRKLRKLPDASATPVVMVTSKDQDSDKFWAEKQGANAYIVKPFSPQELGDVVRRFLG